MLKTIETLLLALLLVAILGCSGVSRKDVSMTSESIGTAFMKDDGTIVLSLRAEKSNNKDVGESQFEYKVSDPYYQKILTHIGGIEKGQTKFVPPWPDKE